MYGVSENFINNKRIACKIFLFVALVLIYLSATNKIYAKESTYEDGIYRYAITDEEKREVDLIGIEYTEEMKELYIPSKVLIHDKEYTIAKFDLKYTYLTEEFKKFYNSISKLIIGDAFTGTIQNISGFINLKSMEFQGDIVPKKIEVQMWNGRENYDILFIVPEGKVEEYKKVISLKMNYYNYSDLYEHDIDLTPEVISSSTDIIEYKTFQKEGFIYKVTKSAKKGEGKVQLIGLTGNLKKSYISLPENIKNDGYSYTLTELSKFSMVGSGAKVVIIPDTVTYLESAIFDKNVEYLFLSKNIKKIPNRLITDENDESSLKFIYIPEGITTIADNAFNNIMTNKASIILPRTIKSIGKKSLYGMKLVTFLNKKPINNISAAIQNGTTVKVSKSAITTYNKLFSSKISVVEAKNIVKSTTLSLNKKSVNISTLKTTKLIGTLSKGSNETVYWTSSDPSIFDISSKGVINPKKAGTAYVVAYTRTSGLHKTIKVTVTDTVFSKGIYTYKITNALKKTVTLTTIKPTNSTTKLTIPEKIVYNKDTYKVTAAVADEKDTSVPLISNKYKNNIIKEIVIPKTITGTVGYLGKMNKIKKITFKGNVPPSSIENWYLDNGIIAKKAIIYVPKGKVKAYKSVLWLGGGYSFTIK